MYENALAVHGQAHRVLGASRVLDGMRPEVQRLAIHTNIYAYIFTNIEISIHIYIYRVLGAGRVLDGMRPEVQRLAGRGELVVQVGVPDKLAAVVDEAVDELPELLAYVYIHLSLSMYGYAYMHIYIYTRRSHR